MLPVEWNIAECDVKPQPTNQILLVWRFWLTYMCNSLFDSTNFSKSSQRAKQVPMSTDFDDLMCVL